jgi:hypothetical protein
MSAVCPPASPQSSAWILRFGACSAYVPLSPADLDGLTDVFNQMIETSDHNAVFIFKLLVGNVNKEQARRLAKAV